MLSSYITSGRTCVLFLCCFFIFNSLPFYVVSLVEIVIMLEKKSSKLKGSCSSEAEQKSCKEFGKSSALFLLVLPLSSENDLLYFHYKQQLRYK